jgi:hypothetical protein
MILPVIKPQSRQNQKTLTVKLDHLLQSCESLEETSPTQQEIHKNFENFHKSLEKLKRLRRPLSLENSSNMIEEYVKEKFKSTEIPVREIMTSTQTSLSFQGSETNNVFQNLSRQKRKFGKTWKDVYIGSNFSDYSKKDSVCKNVEVEGKKRRVQQKNRQNFLDSLIQNYMGKKLGLIYKVRVEKEKKEEKRFRSSRFVQKAETQLKKIMTRARNSICEYPVEHDERDYLAPELNAWTKNTENNLKLEKIIMEQHQKERKQQINSGLHELKIMKYESLSIKFIN